MGAKEFYMGFVGTFFIFYNLPVSDATRAQSRTSGLQPMCAQPRTPSCAPVLRRRQTPWRCMPLEHRSVQTRGRV